MRKSVIGSFHRRDTPEIPKDFHLDRDFNICFQHFLLKEWWWWFSRTKKDLRLDSICKLTSLLARDSSMLADGTELRYQWQRTFLLMPQQGACTDCLPWFHMFPKSPGVTWKWPGRHCIFSGSELRNPEFWKPQVFKVLPVNLPKFGLEGDWSLLPLSGNESSLLPVEKPYLYLQKYKHPWKDRQEQKMSPGL